MAQKLSRRAEAEAIEQFGDDLAALVRAFDSLVDRMSQDTIAAINAMPDQEHLDGIIENFRLLGGDLCRECDEAQEAADRRAMVNVGGHRDGGSAA